MENFCKQKVIRKSGSIVIGVVLFLIFTGCSKAPIVPAPASNRKIPFDKIRSGDIILRHYDDYFGDITLRILDEEVKLTHLGIIQKEKNTFYVIHIIGDDAGVNIIRKNSLQTFVNDSSVKNVIIVRLKGSYNESIIEQAQYYYNKKVKFDYKFNTFDPSEMYCSELLYHILKTINKSDIVRYKSSGPKSIIKFSSFLNEEHFEIIYGDFNKSIL